MGSYSYLVVCFVFLLLMGPGVAGAEDHREIPLPKLQMDSGSLLMKVLKDRKSTRAFSREKLPARVLSNMLWAGNGINRPKTGGRTAPSAMNAQEIDIYVATADGLYLYHPQPHTLKLILAEDIRGLTGAQAYARDVPVDLIYVADLARMASVAPEDQMLYAYADTGFISQNVYLYCASEGLATVVRGTMDRASLAKAMRLRPEQRIVLAQSVGYVRK